MSGSDPFAAFEAGMSDIGSSEKSLSYPEACALMQKVWSEFFAGIEKFDMAARKTSDAYKVSLHMQESKNGPVQLRCTLAAYDASQARFVTDVALFEDRLFFRGGTSEFQAEQTSKMDGYSPNEQTEALAAVGPHIVRGYRDKMNG